MNVGWVDSIEEWALSLRHEDRERASPQPMYADGTLRENVAFGATEVADDKRVTWALERAQLGDWIGSLPEGLDTMVGESGKLVSGGQRQRVAIARSLYRDPQFLILDEATSDVDAATESAILDTLNSLSAQMTTVIVSDWLAPIQASNRVVMLEVNLVGTAMTLVRWRLSSHSAPSVMLRPRLGRARSCWHHLELTDIAHISRSPTEGESDD